MPAFEMKKNAAPHPVLSYASLCQTPLGSIAALCDTDGLCAIRWQQTPISIDLPDNHVSRETIIQLKAYFAGRLKQFSLPLSPNAVSPKLRLWLDAINSVPYGQTISYAGLAKLWGNEKAARGRLCLPEKPFTADNPLPSYHWHRWLL